MTPLILSPSFMPHLCITFFANEVFQQEQLRFYIGVWFWFMSSLKNGDIFFMPNQF